MGDYFENVEKEFRELADQIDDDPDEIERKFNELCQDLVVDKKSDEDFCKLYKELHETEIEKPATHENSGGLSGPDDIWDQPSTSRSCLLNNTNAQCKTEPKDNPKSPTNFELDNPEDAADHLVKNFHNRSTTQWMENLKKCLKNHKAEFEAINNADMDCEKRMKELQIFAQELKSLKPTSEFEFLTEDGRLAPSMNELGIVEEISHELVEENVNWEDDPNNANSNTAEARPKITPDPAK